MKNYLSHLFYLKLLAMSSRKFNNGVVYVKKILCILISFIVLFVVTACKPKETENDVLNINEDNVGEIYYAPIEEEHIAEAEENLLYIDNEILVVASEGAKKEKIESLAKQYDAEIAGFIEKTGDYQWKLNRVKSKEELEMLAESIRSESCIEDAYVNSVFEVSNDAVDSTITLGSEWASDMTGYQNLDEEHHNDNRGKSWGVEAIYAPESWKYMEEHKDRINPVRVGLIDNGFDQNHEDLDFAHVFYDGSRNGVSFEYNEKSDGHGTHIAGTMAATGTNAEGINGVYPYANRRLYGVSSTGEFLYTENGTYSVSTMYQKIAFSELILRNVKIINSSQNNRRDRVDQIVNQKSGWESAKFELDKNSHILGSFLNRLIKCGYDFVIVSASGNGSSTETGNLDSRYNSFINNINETEYPAVFSRIIVVGSINSNFEISTFSNAGNRVDIFAPGENIYSTVPSTNRYEADGWSGTSMASPHVAGVCANVWSMNNNLTGAEVKQIVCDINNCVQHVNVRFSLPNSDTQLTRGIVDCYRAVTNSRVTNEKRNNTDPESNMGSVLGWVVERDENQNDNFLSAAVIRAYQHGQTEPVHFSSIDRDFEVSDIYGHFELILNPGTYDISVQYGNYEVKRKENITVEAGQVHYLNEYIIFEKPKEPQTTTIIQDTEKKTVTTTEVPPAQTPAVIDPYEELLKRYSSDEYYMLVDLIGDSNLELIIRTGTCEADFMFEFWYNDNSNPICMGETGGGHSSLHINPNTKELYRNYAHMDFQEISKISINYNSVSDEKIAKFGDAKHTNSFYTEHYYYNMDIPCITEKYISEYKYEASALSYEYYYALVIQVYEANGFNTEEVKVLIDNALAEL